MTAVQFLEIRKVDNGFVIEAAPAPPEEGESVGIKLATYVETSPDAMVRRVGRLFGVDAEAEKTAAMVWAAVSSTMKAGKPVRRKPTAKKKARK